MLGGCALIRLREFKEMKCPPPLTRLNLLTDVFLVISAGNERQVMAVVDAVEEALHQAGAKRRMREGYSQAHWVLLDYNDIVVHVQREEDREFYAMERLWKDCPQIELPASVLDSE